MLLLICQTVMFATTSAEIVQKNDQKLLVWKLYNIFYKKWYINWASYCIYLGSASGWDNLEPILKVT
jgi:hypothetical protein